MSTWYILVFYVQQAILSILSPLKRIRLQEEIKKAWHEECSRFCWEIWCWGKNLTSKQKKWEQKRITSLKRTTKEKKTTPFFSKPGRVQYKIKYRRALHRMSLETFQMAQRIIRKGLFTWSGGPRSSGVGFFCFHALWDTKQKKLTPTRPGFPTPCKQGLSFNPITKSLGKFERRFKWLNCANI